MVVTAEMVSAAKLARRMTTDAFDAEVVRLLNAALLDLGVAGVVLPENADALTTTAAITYFLMHFGEPDNYERLKSSYDEQKAQLATLTGYTDWGDIEGTTEDTTTAYTVTISPELAVESDPAEILAAYAEGKGFAVSFGNTTMFAQSVTYEGTTLTVTFSRGSALYTLTASLEAATFTVSDAYTGG